MEIIITNLNKTFEEENDKIIDNLNLKVTSEGINCIFGPSGSGKTTLLDILADMPYDSGRIEGIENRKIAYLYQEDNFLDPELTVEENILKAIGDSTKAENQELINQLIDLVELKPFRDYYPVQLSGGMKRQAAIAKVLASNGEVYILDEPFKGLHMGLKKQVMDYIREKVQETNKMLIFITHDIEEILYLADHVHIVEGPPLKSKTYIKIDRSSETVKGEQVEEIKQILRENSY
ncbi:ATP-binding cassette domain-containing protein [Serpentinicella sp. ANB-PHB4]|uniref:ATP-binding cassette domain-containing protein n=1 Tax=Serpentinicella sp. ANB-PHB4 TaxID=3074076 RepID=UPI0028576C87|nr:ATP-binding cassette domain-containing protein [Serpentinicella sp. ANB-PHB4]MDR5658683.1 ATP-binding cassette domain-containing protein [Serpentinicella sp. ANB-PHB4]